MTPLPEPRPQLARLVLALAFAAGGAAVGALFLAGDTQASIVALLAAVTALYGAGAIFTRRPLLVLSLTASPTACALLAHLRPSFLAAIHEAPHVTAASVSIVALGLVLMLAVPARVALRARLAPSHDGLDRVLLTAATWLGAVAGAAAIAGPVWLSSRGGLPLVGAGVLAQGTALAQAAALAAGAALAAAVLVRALQGLALSKTFTTSESLSEDELVVVPRAEIEKGGAGTVAPDVLPWLTSLATDGALVHRTAAGRSAFRTGERRAVVAWVPKDLGAARALLTRRASLAALVLFAQAASALALAYWAHRTPLTHVVAVTVASHDCYTEACALRDDGHVLCWGNEPVGEHVLQSCGERRISSPHPVPGLDDAAQLVAFFDKTCAVRRSGEVTCWGDGVDEARVSDFPRARRISLAEHRGCVLTTTDEVVCFNALLRNWTKVAGIDARGATDLLVDDGGGCVVRPDGLACWNGSADDPAARGLARPWFENDHRWTSDLPLPGTLGWTPVGLCGVTSSGHLRCWDPSPCSDPADRPGLDDLRAHASAPEGTCVIDAGHALRCWDARGEAPPRLLDDVVQVAPGRTTCAVRTDGTVWCWGPSNSHGELGDGTRLPRLGPTMVRE